jgi:hypothetical protein
MTCHFRSLFTARVRWTARTVHVSAVFVISLASIPHVGAQPSAGLNSIRPQAESTKRMVERLAKVPEASDPLVNPYLVKKGAELMRLQLEQVSNPKERLDLTMRYARTLLNDGQTAAALRQLEVYDRMLNLPSLAPTLEQAQKFFETKAVALLRLGEQENCLINHNAESCLLPIRGGGVHVKPEGSRGAIAVLNEWLEIAPSPHAIWLLNVAHMTLGEYPDKVPPRWLIPPKAFESEYDIGRFPDIAGALGLDIDDQAGGVALEDFDHDGFLDLMVSAAGLQSQLRYFHNDGTGSFTELTESAGLTGLVGGLNLNHADYNNDGHADVLVMRGGWEGNDGKYPNSLLRNNGDNTFTDVTEEAGLLSLHPTQTAAWFDYNGDGWLDLFIGNESIPQLDQINPCELYRNNRDGTFTECAKESGVDFVEFVKGVTAGDYNNDGRPDLYISARGFPNRLLRNDGPANPAEPSDPRWRFVDVASSAGVAEPLQSFPCWFFDYDNDGWLDIFVSGYFIANAGDIATDLLGESIHAQRPRLYRNQRDGTFADATKEAGLFRVLHSMGCNFGDLDNDGWLDFYVGTGDPDLSTLIPNRMFRNNAGKNFQDVTTSGGFGQLQKGHAVGFGDINNDGDQDIYAVVGGAYSGDHYHNQLFSNPGHGNRWLKLDLRGVRSNRMAIGARVKVVVETMSVRREIHRVIGTGASFGGSTLRQEIGIGQADRVVQVEVFWPVTGKTQTFRDLKLDRAYALTEDQPIATEIPLKSFALPKSATDSTHHHHAHASAHGP